MHLAKTIVATEEVCHIHRRRPLPMDPPNDNELMISGVMLVITVYMLYAAFLTTGRAQARLAAVIAGPIWVWFVVCIALGLEITYTTDGPYMFDFADNVHPDLLGHDSPDWRARLEHEEET